MQQQNKSKGTKVIHAWLKTYNRKAFQFQTDAWDAISAGESGLVNAPTGFGKTYAVFLGALIRFINDHPGSYHTRKNNGLQLIWVTPLRALAKDIARAMQEVITSLGVQWEIGIRNGDTLIAERQKQKRKMPEVLIITPESMHLLLAQKGYPQLFNSLGIIAVDEWHELLGSKRGVQTELAISRIIHLKKRANEKIQIWGISATIGNLEQARDVLLATLGEEGRIIKAILKKEINIECIYPDEIENYPWAGHLGLKLVEKVVPIIRASTTTLIFINTRGMSERWYQAVLDAAPDLAGAIALHHGSIEPQLRIWVEEALHAAKLKAVICTSSLDLGVDFRPVETVIQVGSPKGVARFLQRAGRSGHRPDAVSHIYFLPTNSLELLEVAALREAAEASFIESREPQILCFDVLAQYLCTLAVSEGFVSSEILEEVLSTYCFASMQEEEWQAILNFLTTGGNALSHYDEYKKVEIEAGRFVINNRGIAMRHRLHIGTIVSDAMLKVKFLSGGYIGVIEEWFISRLDPGTVFTLAGRQLELVMIKDMTVIVRKSNAKKSIVPSWMGGRMPLSANLGKKLREQFNKAFLKNAPAEILALRPLLDVQKKYSHVPAAHELLIEQIETKDGYHLFVYPFEGRLVHEAMAAILAYRISQTHPITFSIAMNDYGFELLSDQPIPVDDGNVYELFSSENLLEDIQRSVNSTEMAKRKFRDISVIGGLVFQGMPGEKKKARHLQSSASLIFSVFSEYDPSNVLLRQAYREVLDQQMEEVRLRNMLERIQESSIIITFPATLTPLCFPIKVDSMREHLTSEKLEDRIRKMQLSLEK